MVIAVLSLALQLSGASAQCPPNTLQATLANPDPTEGDYFGRSVAISGNLAVVGADRDDPGGISESGSSYVFNATTGARVVTLDNPAATAEDFFGDSVAISGNLAVVGAPEHDPGGVVNAGAAYVFDASTGELLSTLNNPAPAQGELFGGSVAISGNLVVVGAPNNNIGALYNIGTAYVFNATTGTLLRTLNNPTPAFGDLFGDSVAISGNLAIIGAHRDDPRGENNFGAAYVFDATTGALITTLDSPEPGRKGQFGWSVSISGDLVGVAAWFAEPGGVSAAGRAYVFDATDGTLISTLNNPDPTTFDLFGSSVAISGNIVVVGAYLDDPDGITDAGTAYVFSAITGELLATLKEPQPIEGSQFGWTVAISDNLAVVGSSRDAPGDIRNVGSAYTFTCTTLPDSQDVADYLTGVETDPTGLDINQDGIVDVADLVAALNA